MNERSIFLDALEMGDADQRRRYLDQACGENQALRNQVEALLVSHHAASNFLETPPAGLAATIVGGVFERTVDEAIGVDPLDFLDPSEKPGCLGTLAQYEVVEVVGRGGMGIVLRAYDTKLNRVVAIKAMAPELAANQMAVKRFLREARAAAAVSHDHVVAIYAVDDAHQPPFIVMEFIDGPSLQEKIDRHGALDVKETLRIGMQVAAGLAAAHRQGLVHRDIKPANILLENGVERVKITDFGLARAADDVSVTQTGQIAGTPQFMSPEQAQGDPLDARSDLFSLGSVLYTMCAGRPPFRAESAVAMLRRVCDDQPRPLREVNSEIPDWLESIIDKLLAKDPAMRFQSAAAVADLLSEHLAHLQHPTTIPQPPRVEAVRSVFQNNVAVAESNSVDGLREPKPRVWPRVATRLTIVFVGFALMAGIATVIYVRMNHGTILVTVHDPQTTVAVDGKAVVINRFGKGEPVYVGVGEHRLLVRHGDAEFETDAFRVKWGERLWVAVEQTENTIWARNGTAVIGRTELSKDNTPENRLTELGRLEGHQDNIEALAFSRDGTMLFSGGGEKLLYHWDVAAATIIRKIPIDDYPLAAAALPDGQHVITSQFSGGVTLWSLSTGRLVRQFAGHTKPVKSIAVSPDGARLLTGGHDGLARLWDIASGEPIHSFSDGYCAAVALSDDGRFAAHGAAGKLRIWETQSGQTLHEIQRNTTSIEAAAFSPSGDFLVSGDGDGLVQVWDVRTGKEIHRFDSNRGKVSSLVFTPDGHRFLTGSEDRTVRVFDLSRGLEIGKIECETSCVSHLAVSHDGQTLVSAGGMQMVKNGSKWEHRKDGDYAIRIWRLPMMDVLTTARQDSRGQETPGVDVAARNAEVTNSFGMTLRLIPAGEFSMGSDRMQQLAPDKDWFFAEFVATRQSAETPKHRVALTKPFYLATHEVTVGQFRQFIDESGYQTTAEQDGSGYGWRNNMWQDGAEFNWQNPGFPQPDEHPVCNVSWDDAVAFCRWLSNKEGESYRLPTEAEWECACRAGTTTMFSTGDNVDSLRGAANLADASLRRQEPNVTWAVAWDDGYPATAPVGSFAANAFGLYDMHGNVCEWCEDEYDSDWYQRSPPTDPVRRGSAGRHVYRGGAWDNWPGFLRSADRYSSHSPTVRTDWAGFRVVREIDEGN